MSFYANAPAPWGEEHRLQGSQYEGFWGTVPRGEVEIVGEEVVDLPAKEMRRKSKHL